jgi:hypothetical protein
VWGEPDRLDEPTNCPDQECLDWNDKNFVFFHGYNVDGQQARGWQAETFKRLFWSGLKGRFWGVSWYGSQTQAFDLATLNYHANVQNAYKTVPALRSFLNTVTGSTTLAAHSLGNMLVSFCLNDSNISSNPNEKLTVPISNFIMIDAAVALEAYMGDNQNPVEQFESSNPMVHPDWYGYQKRLGATEWYTLFDTYDDRNKLTWRNRFADLPNGINYFNYYSSGEEVLDTHLGDPGLIDIVKDGQGRYAWALQEKLKGAMSTSWVLGSSYGGWELNSGYYMFLDKSAANVLPADKLKTIPFFRLGSAAELAETNGSQYAHDNRPKLLAEAFPSLTLPAGGPDGMRLDNFAFGKIKALDMQSTFPNGWPKERENRDDYRWLHSDMRELSYVFISELFNDISRK